MTIVEIIGVISGTGVISTLISWLVSRKVHQANAKKAEADAQSVYSEIYSRLVKDLNDQVTTMKRQVNELNTELERVIAEANRLRRIADRLVRRLQNYEDVKEDI